MPELPEVETTKTSLAPLLGHTITWVNTSQKRLREPLPDTLDTLVGLSLGQVRRRAKYLLLDFYQPHSHAPDKTLLIHLGMSGSLGQFTKSTPIRKHDHVMIGFDNDITLHYHDPRRFGMVMWAKDASSYLDKLGIEPLEEGFDGEYLYNRIWQTPKRPITRPIKSVIMEQKIVVGVGNIYAAESLFLSGIHPATPANLLNQEQLNHLAAHIKAILTKAIEVGGSTLKDFSVGDNQTGYFQQTLLAYGRAGNPCTICHLPLETMQISGRASVFCPSCQPLITTPPISLKN